MTFFVAVANQKGGVAKTTTALSLAGALVQEGQDVLLLDLDAQADLTLALGLNPLKIRHSIAEVLFNWATIVSVSRETRIPGLDIVPANQEMGLAERFLPIRKNFETILRNAVATSLPYDFVIFDCPPSIGAVTVNALNAANLLIIPTMPEIFSIHALKNILALARRIHRQSNPGLVYRILITMKDRRNRIHRDLSARLSENLGERLFRSVIEVDTKLRESAVAGLPITDFFPKSRSAHQYRALTQEILQHAQEKLEQPV